MKPIITHKEALALGKLGDNPQGLRKALAYVIGKAKVTALEGAGEIA